MTENQRKERILDIVTELLDEHPELTDEQLDLFIATANPGFANGSLTIAHPRPPEERGRFRLIPNP